MAQKVMIEGSGPYPLGNGWEIVFDRGLGGCTVECEVRHNADGSISILNIQECPPEQKNT